MDPALDYANICLGCGRGCGYRKRFCDNDCFERWMEQDRSGVYLNPGHSILPNFTTEETRWQQQPK